MFEVLYENIHVGLEKTHKLNIHLSLIILILCINAYFVIQRFVIKRDDPKFIQLYKDIYHDFLKYLFIETAVILTEFVNTNTINIANSIGRIAFIHIALVVFHNVKWVIEDII